MHINNTKNNLSPEGIVSLTKRRVYRFSDDLNSHALMEEIENKFINSTLDPKTIEELLGYLQRFELSANAKLNTTILADLEHVDARKEVDKRLSFETSRKEVNFAPDKYIFIIGSPRSGTSFLYNLMAFQGIFSYFTNVSHHAWSYYNLTNLNGKKKLHTLGKEFFKRDTKENRLITNVIFPDEAENILSRGIPSYEPLRRNQYLLKNVHIVNPDLLNDSINAHAKAFNSKYFLSKSPFNSFRMPQLIQLYGSKAQFIHIHRNGYAASESILKNGFKYFTETDNTDDSGLFWSRHIESVIKNTNETNSYSLAYEDLIEHPAAGLKKIWNWLKLPMQEFLYDTKYERDDRENTINSTKIEPLIEKYNKLLGYKTRNDNT